MKLRAIRIHFKDGTHRDLPVTGFSALPADFTRSLSLQEKKGKGTGFHMCVSKSLVEDFSQVTNLEVIRS